MPWEWMPKHLAKTRTLAFMDERYNDMTTRTTTLERLRHKDTKGEYDIALTDVGSIDALGNVVTPAGANASVTDNKDHLNQHWFGHNDPPGKVRTGWWHGWKGRPEAVMRETLIRTLEVAMGLRHDEDPRNARRQLPVDFYWICGLPRFESYISWNDRQATVIILTPGFSADDLILEVLDSKPDDPAYLDDWITDLRMPRGIVFVGQNVDETRTKYLEMEDTVIVHRLDLRRGGAGHWPWP